MKRGFLLIPVFALLSVFTVDKIAGIDAVKFYTQSDATFLYYDYKPEMIEELKAYDAKRKSGEDVPPKLLIVIGSSRLMYYSYDSFRRNFPRWEVYNFSAPVNSPAYYAYIIERILETGVKPDLVLLESDPFQFNENSPGFQKSNLGYTFDLRFILSNFGLFTRDEVSGFLARTLFSGYRYKPDLSAVIDRLQNPKHKLLLGLKELDRYQRENNGNGKSIIPKPDWFDRDYASLAVTSRMTTGWIYGNYEMSERQWVFFEDTLDLLKKDDVPFLLIRPQVSRPMTAILQQNGEIRTATKEWKKRLTELNVQSRLLDLSDGDPFYCNAFVDGSHMALECYDPMLWQVMDRYAQISAPSRIP